MTIMAAQMCVGCSRPSPDYYSRCVKGRIKTGCCMIRGAEGVIPIFSCNINSIVTAPSDPVTLITHRSLRDATVDHVWLLRQRGNV